MRSSIRSLARRAGLVWLLAASAVAPAAAQSDSVNAAGLQGGQRPAVWARVSYLSGPSVYIDAGTTSGLREGMAVEVVRAGAAVAMLQVAFVSSTRASCTIVSAATAIQVGDSVRFTPERGDTAVADTTEPSGSAPAARRATMTHGRSLHGRVGVRYLALSTSPGAGGFTQPAFDARLDGRLGAAPLAVAVDVRAYRTRLTGETTPRTGAGETRVYQAALRFQSDRGPARLSLGRQFATTVSPIGLFDGVAADLTWRRWSAGAFGGTQPDPIGFGYSPLVREYGAWLQAHSAPGTPDVWSFTTAAVGSYQAGEVNREFLYVQGLVVTRRISLYASQEVDYNRGWKTDAGESSTTPTSTFATLRVSPVDDIAVTAGIDNRRSVRLYRDWISPETEFDDSFRRGVWGGANVTVAQHLQVAADIRSSDGGPAGRAESRSASLGIVRLTRLRLGIRGRATSYSGEALDGSLQSGSIEMSPVPTLRVEVSGGIRRDSHALAGAPPVALRWFGGDADLALGRSLYLMFSMQYESRRTERGRQSYTALSWRF